VKRSFNDRSSSGRPLEGGGARLTTKEAFRTSWRSSESASERSGRPFLLLLVDLKEQPGLSVRIRLPGRPQALLGVCGSTSATAT